MATTTPAEIHKTIVLALGAQARDCRKLAAGRRMAGLDLADLRAALRAEAQRCEDLQRTLGHVAPEALASVLEAKPYVPHKPAETEENRD